MPLFYNLFRLYHTLRHLKFIQIYRRVWFRLVKPKPEMHPAPDLRILNKDIWCKPAARRQSMVGAESFLFLNEKRTLAECSWDDPKIPKLWLYNLHYFDDLNASEAFNRTEWQHNLILRWIDENPVGVGSGWEPYPLSLRVVNWIKWALADNHLTQATVLSLAIQGRFLEKRLEWHLLGNHLFINAKALVFLGIFFEGEEADRWYRKGLAILNDQIPEQILNDGGHFELSPMYHALALEDMLDLVNITRIRGVEFEEENQNCIIGMLTWLQTMCHDDGEISHFNDSAIGIAPPPNELKNYAHSLGFKLPECTKPAFVHLEDSGYIGLERLAYKALIDVARVGPDYIPGHAHADCLSFEVSCGKLRIFTNSGTSIYGLGEERTWQRSTAAHNTVTIDGRNSSDVWSGFRVGRRAYPEKLKILDENGSITVSCTHNGYAHLNQNHERKWIFEENRLIIEDKVTGDFEEAVARFYLAPGLVPILLDDCTSSFRVINDEILFLLIIDCGIVQVEPATYHPEFGISVDTACISVCLEQGRSKLIMDFSSAHSFSNRQFST